MVNRVCITNGSEKKKKKAPLAGLAVEKKNVASRIAAVVPLRLPQRESRTTCNLGINSFSLLPSLSLSLSLCLFVRLSVSPALSRAVSPDEDSGDRREGSKAKFRSSTTTTTTTTTTTNFAR